jgi:hypothetical protein
MQANSLSLLRVAGLVAGAALLLSPVRLLGAGDGFPEFKNHVTISATAPSVTGNKAAFQQRAQQYQKFGGGVEDLHFTKDVAKGVNLEVDARVLQGAEDYLGQFRLTKNEVGTIDAGFKSFRNFYDNIGGFFPVNGYWRPLRPEAAFLDRSKFWFDATVAMPGKPVYTLRYVNEMRAGRKDTTIWGSTDNTGLPNVLANPIAGQTNALLTITPARRINGSYLDLGERHEEWEAAMKHKVGKTTFQFTTLLDRVKNLNTRGFINAPGELRPVVTPSANSVIPWYIFANEASATYNEGIKSKTFSLIASAVTTLNQQWTLRSAVSFALLNSDLSGDRSTVTKTPTNVGPVNVLTADFINLDGGSRNKVYTANVGLDYKASKDLFVKMALRGEDKYVKGTGNFTAVAAATNVTTGVVTRTDTPRLEWSRIKEKILTPVGEVRYSGLKDIALYATGSWHGLTGDERYSTAYNPLTATTGTLALNDLTHNRGVVTVGGTWRHSPMLTMRGETFFKDHQFKAEGYGSRAGDHYVLDSQFKGVKLSATARPDATVSCTTRYVYRKAEMQVTSIIPGGEKYDSGDVTSHTISESIDWSPNKQVYVQGNVDVVFHVVSTVYPRAGYTAQTATAAGFDSNKLVQNSNNNYVTGSVIVGAVLDKENDLQVQATYYRANNGDAYLARYTQPYGADGKEMALTVGLKHKFSDRLVGSARIGYIDSKNNTTGGMTNFKGPVAYVSLTTGL